MNVDILEKYDHMKNFIRSKIVNVNTNYKGSTEAVTHTVYTISILIALFRIL